MVSRTGGKLGTRKAANHDTIRVSLTDPIGTYDGCKRDSNARRSAGWQADGHAEKYGPRWPPVARFFKLEKLGVPRRAISLYKAAIQSR